MSFRALGLAASIVQLVLMTAYLALETVYGQGFLSGLVGFLSILVFPAVGLVILSRHPRHLVGLLFCISQIGWAVNNPAGSYARAGVLPATWLAVWLYMWPGILSSGLTVLLLLVFPNGRFLSPRWRRFGQVALAGAVILALAVAVAPGPVDPSIGIRVDNPLGMGGVPGDVAATVGALGFPLVVPAFLVAAIAMALRYRRSGPVEREQLKWFASSAGFAAVLIVIEFVLMVIYHDAAVTPFWVQAFGQVAILSLSLVPVAAAFAIFRYRLYDIDLIIRGTIVYAAVTVALATTFFGGIVLLQGLLRPFTGGNELAVAGSTLASVALFQPLRARIQGAVDHRFYRSRYDAVRILDSFSARLRDEVDLDAVRADLVDAVQRTVQPAHASLWLRERSEAMRR